MEFSPPAPHQITLPMTVKEKAGECFLGLTFSFKRFPKGAGEASHANILG